jgi:hypothetical protein
MLMSKRCLKCQHVAEIEYSDTAACPACGAVYSKVEQSARAVGPAPAAASEVDIGAAPPKVPSGRAPQSDGFIEVLRAESIYPTFRGFVQVFYVLGLVLAAMLFVGGIIGGFMSGGATPGMVGAGTAVLFVLLARLFKETWLMLADLSDAMIRVARRDQ